MYGVENGGRCVVRSKLWLREWVIVGLFANVVCRVQGEEMAGVGSRTQERVILSEMRIEDVFEFNVERW